MKIRESVLREEKLQLEKIVEGALKRLGRAPEGHLRIAQKSGSVEYYYRDEEMSNLNGRYLRKDERTLVTGLAQRDYDAQVVKLARERIKAIDLFVKKYEKTSLERLYEKISSPRKALIDAPIISDEEYVRRWLAVEYSGKEFENDRPEIITERGERVRSKSEKIIADKLYALGIAYRYEYPILLEGCKIYPDFTILLMPARKEVYLEHLGMMDDSNYVEKVMYKLCTYERNGIYPGINLFITHETSRNPLNTRALDEMLRKLFCVE